MYMAYDAKNSHSGLYVFNPIEEASELKGEISLVQVFVYDGDIMKCV
jgi:hypothetical protein